MSAARERGDATAEGVESSRVESRASPAQVPDAYARAKRAKRAAAARYNYLRDGSDVVGKSAVFQKAAKIAKALVEGNPYEPVPDPACRAVIVSLATVGARATRGCFNRTSTLECLSDHKGVKNEASTLRETSKRDDHLGSNRTSL